MGILAFALALGMTTAQAAGPAPAAPPTPPAAAHAQPPAPRQLRAPAPKRLHLFEFRGGFIASYNNDGFESQFDVAGIAGWTPSYYLTRSWFVRASVSGSLFKGLQSLFPVIEGQLALGKELSPSWAVELGGGAQDWFDRGIYPTGSLVGAFRFGEKFLGLVDRLYAEYSLVLSQFTTHQLRVGIQLAF